MEGMRKWWMILITVAALMGGLALVVIKGTLTDAMWTTWCAATAGAGGGYAVANVVSKLVTNGNGKPKAKKK
jgi:hypothetical protein